MANYYGNTRTNYFRVKDEDRYQELFAGLCGDEDGIHDFSQMINGEMYHGFGSYGSIWYRSKGSRSRELWEEDDEDISDEDLEEEEVDDGESTDFFYNELSKIVHDDDAAIITEVGNEKLRYLVGCAIICAHGKVEAVDIETVAIAKAAEMIGNPGYTCKNSY